MSSSPRKKLINKNKFFLKNIGFTFCPKILVFPKLQNCLLENEINNVHVNVDGKMYDDHKGESSDTTRIKERDVYTTPNVKQHSSSKKPVASLSTTGLGEKDGLEKKKKNKNKKRKHDQS